MSNVAQSGAVLGPFHVKPSFAVATEVGGTCDLRSASNTSNRSETVAGPARQGVPGRIGEPVPRTSVVALASPCSSDA